MNLAPYIDHTALKPDATQAQIEKLCQEAIEHKFFSVCLNPCWVPLAAKLCAKTDVKVCTVIGFPLGANTTELKGLETAKAVEQGATELDMVLNIGFLKSKFYQEVEQDIKAVVKAAGGNLVKVIIETCLLTDQEKIEACKLSVAAGAHYVKTSTGFSTSGATINDIRLMREAVGPSIGVKASGGIRDKATALAMIQAGASRIGTSSGVTIVKIT